MTEHSPLVSIITPAYNYAHFLPETVESILSQDYPNFEYIVLNDGSTDNTADILNQYAGRIITETHPNMGQVRTVNKALAMAKGDFFMIVNADDTLLPGALSKTVAMMQANPDLLLVYPDWIMTDQESNPVESVTAPDYDYVTMLRRHLCYPGAGTLIRRRAYDLEGGMDVNLRYIWDYDYYLRVGLHGPFAHLPEALATFRVHPNSATQGQKGLKMADEHVNMIKALYRRHDLPPEVRAIKGEAMSIACLVASEILRDSGIPQKARRYYLWHPQRLLHLNLAERVAVLRIILPEGVFVFLRWWSRFFRPVRKRVMRGS